MALPHGANWVGLQCVIVVIPDHTHLLLNKKIAALILTLLQCLPIPIRKLSGFISLWMKFLLCTYSILLII